MDAAAVPFPPVAAAAPFPDTAVPIPPVAAGAPYPVAAEPPMPGTEVAVLRWTEGELGWTA